MAIRCAPAHPAASSRSSRARARALGLFPRPRSASSRARPRSPSRGLLLAPLLLLRSRPRVPPPRRRAFPAAAAPIHTQIDMNPLRPPSSNSRRGKSGRGRGATAVVGARAASIDGARVAPADGSSPAAASPPVPSLPAWWTNPSPMGSTEGVYPQGGFTNFLESNGGSENFHLVFQTTSRTTISPTAPNLKRTLPINVDDADRTNDEEERTERRLPYTKDEDVRLASAWLRKSKDPVEGTDRPSVINNVVSYYYLYFYNMVSGNVWF